MVSRKVNRDFFKKWSSQMAYTLGFFFADGTLTVTKRGGHYISFHSADKRLLLQLRKAMSSTHVVAKRSVRSGEVYRLQIGSAEIFNDLHRLGLLERKTKRIKPPDIPQAFFGDFLRGYFDGDGNVWVGKINRRRKNPTKVIQLCLTSGCGEFLGGLLQKLRERGVQGGSIFSVKNKQCQRLSFSTRDALKLAEFMYNVPHKLFLPRKKKVFEQFVQMRT